MKKWLFTCLVVLLAHTSVYAEPAEQDANAPRVSVSVENNTTSVGAMNLVQVKILVPTWFTEPVYFDEIESLNLISVKADKSSFPVSERIGSNTWSGVVREYSVIPMKAGNFELNVPDVSIQYMGDDNTKRRETISVPAVKFKASVPSAAQDLSPLIVADKLSLEQSLSVPDELKAGQSVARTLTVTIDGSSALFIPQLMQDKDDDFQRAYLRPAAVKDTLNSREGTLVGQREETQDVLLKKDGTLNLPDISISYYNSQSEEVETVSVEGRSISVAAADLTLKQWLVRIAIALILLALFALLAQQLNKRIKRYHRSEQYQFKRLLSACNHADGTLLKKVYRWRNRWQKPLLANREQSNQLSRLVLAMEETVRQGGHAQSQWKTQLTGIRNNLLDAPKAKGKALAPLNPT